MRDKTKRIISNSIIGAVALYGLLALIIYILPVVFASSHPIITGMGQHFILIPFVIVGVLLTIFVPFVLLILLLVGLEWVLFRLMRVGSES